jgi:hypothetical protein
VRFFFVAFGARVARNSTARIGCATKTNERAGPSAALRASALQGPKVLKRDTTTVRSPGPPFVAGSYGQTPLESQFSNVRRERSLTLEVKPLIRLTPKFPRIVAPTAFPVPED